MTDIETLDQLPVGGRCVIWQVENQRGAVKRRLIDMGLTPGTQVQLTHLAPLGDPMELRLRGYALSLRREDARRIQVRPAGEGWERGWAAPEGAYHTGGPCVGPCHGCPVGCPAEWRPAAVSLEHRQGEEDCRADGEVSPSAGGGRAALAGNPNSGKTTLFNALTGANQSVGNWPGVTVERKEGTVRSGGFTLVDLPGIYSLSPYSLEERTARRFLAEERPEVIINIVDAANLERNLYLTTQLLELERPMVVALNFMDEVERRGDRIDCRLLEAQLGVPVVPISAREGRNLDTLVLRAKKQMAAGAAVEPDGLYDDLTHVAHHRIAELIRSRACRRGISVHWAAVKLLEGDGPVADALGLGPEERTAVEAVAGDYEAAGGLGDRETLLADSRYRFVEQAVRCCLRRGRRGEKPTVSERIDAVATHRYLAVPLFLAVMLGVFYMTFSGPGAWLSRAAAALVERVICPGAAGYLTALGAPAWLRGVLVDGLLAGVGGVLTFLPMVALLFVCLAVLEDSGYMARAAFVMDRVLRRFGLSGKAFIPMLMGFGCTVPAVLAARTMESEKDRRMTILLTPFMSCGARLPIYALMTAAFFPDRAALAVFALYLLGPAAAVVSGLILKRAVFQGDPAPFLLELPPYRMPTARSVGRRVGQRVGDFLTRAGTLIAAMSTVLWCLQHISTDLRLVEDAARSMLAWLGSAVAPVFAPMGFGLWQAAVALLAGLAAKEAVVSTLALLCAFSPLDAVQAGATLSGLFSPAAAAAFLAFSALYTPCVAAISAIHREMEGLSWTLLALVWQLGVAWLVSFAVYQAAAWLG